MNKKFITLHQPADNSVILIRAEDIIMATESYYGNTGLIVTYEELPEKKKLFFVNESVERIKNALTEAGFPCILVHGRETNNQMFVTIDNIFAISEDKYMVKGKNMAGSVIRLRQNYIKPIECNEIYSKIVAQMQ